MSTVSQSVVSWFSGSGFFEECVQSGSRQIRDNDADFVVGCWHRVDVNDWEGHTHRCVSCGFTWR